MKTFPESIMRKIAVFDQLGVPCRIRKGVVIFDMDVEDFLDLRERFVWLDAIHCRTKYDYDRKFKRTKARA